MKPEPPPHIEDEYLPLVADILDGIDPALTAQQREEAIERAIERNATAAVVLATGMLEGMIRSFYEHDPNVMKTIRAQAASLKEDPSS